MKIPQSFANSEFVPLVCYIVSARFSNKIHVKSRYMPNISMKISIKYDRSQCSYASNCVYFVRRKALVHL